MTWPAGQEMHTRRRTGRKADHRRLRAGDGACRPGCAEQRPAGLVRDDHRDDCEHRREVEDNLLRVGSRHPSDQREEAVPEREGVAGMQARVRKLAHCLQR